MSKKANKHKQNAEHQLRQAIEREAQTTKKEKTHGHFMPHIPDSPHELALYDRAVFTWIAPEYIQHPKSKSWFLGAAVISIVVVILDILTNNLTMALAVVVLAAVYYYVHTHHPPKDIKITVSRMGIKVGNMIFPYSSIQAFWIIYTPPHITTLNLRVKEHFFSDINIQLNHEDPVPIREFLCGQIPEWEGKGERLGDVILRLLKL
jgi:hypothetical protein